MVFCNILIWFDFTPNDIPNDWTSRNLLHLEISRHNKCWKSWDSICSLFLGMGDNASPVYREKHCCIHRIVIKCNSWHTLLWAKRTLALPITLSSVAAHKLLRPPHISKRIAVFELPFSTKNLLFYPNKKITIPTTPLNYREPPGL